MSAATLKTYQQFWTHKNRDGWQYDYLCTWSDGSESRECTLPWGRMDGAIEVRPDPAQSQHKAA